MHENVDVEQHVARIAEAPRGPEIGAFFDYDGTVISGYSASAFYRKRFRDRTIGPVELAEVMAVSPGRGLEQEAVSTRSATPALGEFKKAPSTSPCRPVCRPGADSSQQEDT